MGFGVVGYVCGLDWHQSERYRRTPAQQRSARPGLHTEATRPAMTRASPSPPLAEAEVAAEAEAEAGVALAEEAGLLAWLPLAWLPLAWQGLAWQGRAWEQGG